MATAATSSLVPWQPSIKIKAPHKKAIAEALVGQGEQFVPHVELIYTYFQDHIPLLQHLNTCVGGIKKELPGAQRAPAYRATELTTNSGWKVSFTPGEEFYCTLSFKHSLSDEAWEYEIKRITEAPAAPPTCIFTDRTTEWVFVTSEWESSKHHQLVALNPAKEHVSFTGSPSAFLHAEPMATNTTIIIVDEKVIAFWDPYCQGKTYPILAEWAFPDFTFVMNVITLKDALALSTVVTLFGGEQHASPTYQLVHHVVSLSTGLCAMTPSHFTSKYLLDGGCHSCPLPGSNFWAEAMPTQSIYIFSFTGLLEVNHLLTLSYDLAPLKVIDEGPQGPLEGAPAFSVTSILFFKRGLCLTGHFSTHPKKELAFTFRLPM